MYPVVRKHRVSTKYINSTLQYMRVANTSQLSVQSGICVVRSYIKVCFGLVSQWASAMIKPQRPWRQSHELSVLTRPRFWCAISPMEPDTGTINGACGFSGALRQTSLRYEELQQGIMSIRIRTRETEQRRVRAGRLLGQTDRLSPPE